MSSKLVGPSMRHRVQTDGAQVPSGRGLCRGGRLRAWRSRGAAAPLLHTVVKAAIRGWDRPQTWPYGARRKPNGEPVSHRPPSRRLSC